MTFLMMIAALISVLVDRLGGVWVLVAVAVVLYLVRRIFAVRPEVLDGCEGGSADTGRPDVVYDLTDSYVARPAQRITQYRVAGNNLVPASENGGVVAHQHLGDIDGNLVVDVMGGLPAADD